MANGKKPGCKTARRLGGVALLLFLFVGAAASAAAQTGLSSGNTGGCREKGKNVQCNDFGHIEMESQRDIRGDPIKVGAEITLDETYSDQGARWIMFSIRHVPESGSSPVLLELNKFESSHGDVVTTKIDQPSSNEINIWVHVVDVPVGEPIALEVGVGAEDRGAFRLETLVMAFDRGYAPLQDRSGEDRSLYSFTLLGVNTETGGTGGFLPTRGASGVPLVATLLALIGVGFVLTRRRRL